MPDPLSPDPLDSDPAGQEPAAPESRASASLAPDSPAPDDAMMSNLLPPEPPAREGFFARVLSVLVKPSETFDRIADEDDSVPALLTGYVAPLAAIGPVCRIIGASLVGLGPFGAVVHVPFVWSILAAVTEYVLSLGMVFLLAFVIHLLAARFEARRDALAAFKLAAYAPTPAWLAGLFNLVPAVGFLAVLGLYAVYLVYAGLPWVMKNPANRSLLYTAGVTVCGIVMAVIIGAVAGRLTTLGTVHARSRDAAPAGLPTAHAVASSSAAAARVQVADARALLALMPPLYNGAARADTTTASADGLSTAEATYSFGGGSIHLKISDAAAASALAASGASTGPGDETVETAGNRTTRQAYDATDKSGHYIVTQSGRIVIEADGTHVDVAQLKALASQVDPDKIAALEK